MIYIPHECFADMQTAKSICVMNSVTGEIVFESNAREKMPMASTTKIMTLIVALENAKMDDVAEVSYDAAYSEGSSAYLKPNAKITMRDLCYGLMLNSGNDAAVAIAQHISGDIADFARLMNETARKIGVSNTQFKNPSGLQDDEHYTTAYELAKITRYALKNEMFRKIVSTKAYTARMYMPDGSVMNVEYINHNRLLKEIDGCIGVKTGFTKAAGRSLVSAVKRDDAEYIIVTLNDSDDWNTHKNLYESVLGEQKKRILVKKGDCIKHAVCDREECRLVATEDFSVYFKNERENRFEIVKHIPKTLDFPMNKGEKVGYIEIKTNGETIGTVDIAAEKDFTPSGETEVKNCFMFTFIGILRSLI